MQKANKTISLTTATLVFLVAIGSFSLSYSALRDVAIQNGIDESLTYIWPLLVDFSMIVFSLSVVNAYLQSESTWKQWALVGVYTVATVSFNVLHAPQNLQAMVVAAIAPVSLFFSFEILMSQLKNSVKRLSLLSSLEQLAQDLEQKRLDFDAKIKRMRSSLREKFNSERSKLNAEIERLNTDIKQLNAEAEQSRLTLDKLNTDIKRQRLTLAKLNEQKGVQHGVLNEVNAKKLNGKEAAKNQLLDFYRLTPNGTHQQAGDYIKKSPGTISIYLNELEESGLITRNNGGGVKVIS